MQRYLVIRENGYKFCSLGLDHDNFQEQNSKAFVRKAMAPPQLSTLPKEMIIRICDSLSLPQDLRNLQWTCKAIEYWATARLYRDTDISLTRSYHHDPLYKEDHRAHGHIKHLTFELDVEKAGYLENAVESVGFDGSSQDS